MIAEGAPAKLGEQNDVRRAAPCVQHGGRHRGFVRGLQNQRRKRFPVGRRHTGVGHWERGVSFTRERSKVRSLVRPPEPSTKSNALVSATCRQRPMFSMCTQNK